MVLDELALGSIFTTIPIGIAAGLFFGKQIGIFLFSWLAVKLKLAPAMRWSELYGVSLLCGIGFSMSLFISSLAFEQNGTDYLPVDRLGILIGSFAAAIFGYVYLNWILPKKTD